MTGYNGNLTVAPYGAVTRLLFSDSAGNPIPAVVNGECTALKLSAKDSQLTTRTFIADTTISLSSQPAGTFYSDATCTTVITSIVGTNGSSFAGPFYFKSTANGWAYLDATAPYTQGSTYTLSGHYSFPVGAVGTPVYFDVGLSANLPNNQCAALTVTALDAQGNPANVTNDTLIYFEGLMADFYGDWSDCSTQVSSTPPEAEILSGGSSVTVYVRSVYAGHYHVRALHYANGKYLNGETDVSVDPMTPIIPVTMVGRQSVANNDITVAWDPVTDDQDTQDLAFWVTTDSSGTDDYLSGVCLGVAPVANGVTSIFCSSALVSGSNYYVKIAGRDFMSNIIESSIIVVPLLTYRNIFDTRMLSIGNSVTMDLLTTDGSYGPISPSNAPTCTVSGSLTGDASLTGCSYTAPSSGNFVDEIIINDTYNGVYLEERVQFTD